MVSFITFIYFILDCEKLGYKWVVKINKKNTEQKI
jgi:hypothetical protein